MTTGEDLLTEKQCRRAADCTEKYRAGWEAITEREVSLKYKTEYEDVSIQVEGRADGIFTEDGQCWIDEIKGVYADVSQLEKPVEVHRAQAMCYAWIYAQEQKRRRSECR